MALAVTSCSSDSGTGDPEPAPTRSTRSTCTLSARAVPSCGVLWGVSTTPPTEDQLRTVEKAAGRPFDFVYRYHDVNDVVPDAQERTIVADGRLLHIAIAARDFAAASRAGVSWADVARGRYDDSLSAQARGVASLEKPVFVTFEQEANQRTKLGVVGDAADFKAAWRHLHGLYVTAGATNAVWTWVMTGNPDNIDRAATLWPGNDVVDWISWNVYNQSGCHSGTLDQDKFKSFDDETEPFYDFVQERGASIGMDSSKPMMISEAGSVQYPDAPELSADWYAAIPTTLRSYPGIKAVALWDSVADTCNYDFDADSDVVAGVRRAGLDPSLDIGGALSPRG
jgi:hypothetical protein